MTDLEKRRLNELFMDIEEVYSRVLQRGGTTVGTEKFYLK